MLRPCSWTSTQAPAPTAVYAASVPCVAPGRMARLEAMPEVELLHDDECPNVALARTNLHQAFVMAGLAPNWLEQPLEYTRGYGSPTVLVDGQDVAGGEPIAGACCRVYESAGRMTKAPDVGLIAEALLRSVCNRV